MSTYTTFWTSLIFMPQSLCKAKQRKLSFNHRKRTSRAPEPFNVFHLQPLNFVHKSCKIILRHEEIKKRSTLNWKRNAKTIAEKWSTIWFDLWCNYTYGLQIIFLEYNVNWILYKIIMNTHGRFSQTSTQFCKRIL